MKCIKCGSFAFNLKSEGIDQGDLCDVHYWQERAHRAEALAEQPAQQERNFCPRCGKRVGSNDWDVHTCTPPQRTWVDLTDEEIMAIGRGLGAKCRLGGNPNIDFDYARAIETKLKETNT